MKYTSDLIADELHKNRIYESVGINEAKGITGDALVADAISCMSDEDYESVYKKVKAGKYNKDQIQKAILWYYKHNDELHEETEEDRVNEQTDAVSFIKSAFEQEVNNYNILANDFIEQLDEIIDNREKDIKRLRSILKDFKDKMQVRGKSMKSYISKIDKI